jgi:acid phosphatase type 7
MLRQLVLVFCCLPSLFAASIDNLRVVWTTEPQHNATVIWDSKEITEGDFIVLSNGETQQKIKAGPTQAYGKDGSKEDSHYFFRHVQVSGLQASTTYRLTASSMGQSSREYYFTTAPKDNREITLVYAGDSRSDIETAQKISEQLADLAKSEDILALLHGGDYAKSPDLEFWIPWLEAYSRTTGKDGRLLPIIPVCGNHEAWQKAPLFGQAYGFPGGDGLFYYDCQLSAEVGIVILSTETSAAGLQKDFLRKSLKQYQDEKRLWRITAYHRPLYPAVKEPATAKPVWVPLFEEFNVDLSLESDGHCIKRTLPIKNEKVDAAGVVYLGEGGYGAPQREPKDRWYLKEPGFSSSAHHVMLLKFSTEAIHYRAISPEGQILDQMEFKPKKR